MKLLPALFWLIAAAASAAPIELPLDIGTIKLRDGKVYEEAKVIGQDAVGVKIMHAGGTARVPFAKLPKDLADRFPRDPQAAKEQLEKESKAEAAHDRTVDKAVAKQKAVEDDEEGEAKDSPLEKLPEAGGDNSAKIAALEGYIRRIEDGIEQAGQDAAKARERASYLRASATYTVTSTDSQGQMQTSSRHNSSKARKADYLDRRANRCDGKIAEARLLIQDARRRIVTLEKAG